MPHKLLGVDVFQVDSVQKHELGIKATDVKGGEGTVTIQEFLHPNTSGVYIAKTSRRVYDASGVYRYVKAVGANIAAGDAVTSDRTAGDVSVPFHVIETAGEAVVEGIAMAAIPNGSFGWIQTEGRHYEANVLDAVADDTFLESAAGGSLVAATNDVALLQAVAHGCSLRKICDASVLGGAADKGVVEIRS